MSELVVVTQPQRGVGPALVRKLESLGYTVIGLTFAQNPGASMSELIELARSSWQGRKVSRLVNNIWMEEGIQKSAAPSLADAADAAIRLPTACLRAMLPSMQSSGFGRVVNVVGSAVPGLWPWHGPVGETVGAATRSWAMELGARAIHVNAVAVGAIDIPEFHRLHSDPHAYAASVPLGRIAQATEVAGVVGFLLGPDASYMTGQTLHVCGGLSIG
ncbi:MAG: SDR family oxidoreductase [Burkholderiaceae bacterium]|nr:SDR family oxidoreductase [Burkholderiaceae bacterium]